MDASIGRRPAFTTKVLATVGRLLAGVALVLICELTGAQPLEPERPLILFEQVGVSLGRAGGAPSYRLAVFADGKVVFTGVANTRVLGDEWLEIGQERAAYWLHEFEVAGAFRPRTGERPAADANWYRLSVAVNGGSNSFGFVGWNLDSATVKTLQRLLWELRVSDRWIEK